MAELLEFRYLQLKIYFFVASSVTWKKSFWNDLEKTSFWQMALVTQCWASPWGLYL